MPLRTTLFATLALAGTALAQAGKEAPLPPADPNANKLSATEVAEGWVLLFDGTKLTALRGTRPGIDPLKNGWVIDRGALTLPKDIKRDGKVTGGDLVANVAFDDFDFRFEFRLAASADSGVLYFARGGLGQRLTGCEYQIIDDVHHPDGLKGGPLRQTAALYGVLPRAGEGFVRVAQRWNEELWNEGAIVVRGPRVEHWLNGEKRLEYDLGANLAQRAAAAKVRLPAGFGAKVKSPVVLLDQGTEVAFRNLKIRPLPAPAPGTLPPLAPPPTATPVPGSIVTRPTPLPMGGTTRGLPLPPKINR
jgi:hypothetical protein